MTNKELMEMIAAEEAGKKIECRVIGPKYGWALKEHRGWNTGAYEYRIAFEPPVAKIEFAGRFVLFDDAGREIVAVNTKTGKVKLRGNPNEAAKRFWRAVEMMYPGMKKTRE